MLFYDANSIHTFFMSYAIDCVFINKKFEVVSIVENIKPNRMVWPQWKARSVIELASGQAKSLGLQIGEQLYVGH